MRISDWSSDVCSSDLLGFAAIAVSTVSIQPQHFETAARVTLRLLEQIQRQPIPGDTILNVNVPDLPWQQLQGLAVTRAGNRHRAETTLQTTDPRGRTIYWIGTAGAEADCGPGTDFHAIAAGKVSITPLLVDLTRHNMLEHLSQWATHL